MNCQICQKKEATVHFTEIDGDKMVKLHLCEECAKKKGIGIDASFALTNFLGTLSEGEVVNEEVLVTCPQCGMSLKDFRTEGRLGCGRCYETFKKTLGALIKTLHKCDHHCGKAFEKAPAANKPAAAFSTLQLALKEAVEKEQYEKAAGIRDQIKKAKNRTAGDDKA